MSTNKQHSLSPCARENERGTRAPYASPPGNQDSQGTLPEHGGKCVPRLRCDGAKQNSTNSSHYGFKPTNAQNTWPMARQMTFSSSRKNGVVKNYPPPPTSSRRNSEITSGDVWYTMMWRSPSPFRNFNEPKTSGCATRSMSSMTRWSSGNGMRCNTIDGPEL